MVWAKGKNSRFFKIFQPRIDLLIDFGKDLSVLSFAILIILHVRFVIVQFGGQRMHNILIWNMYVLEMAGSGHF